VVVLPSDPLHHHSNDFLLRAGIETARTELTSNAAGLETAPGQTRIDRAPTVDPHGAVTFDHSPPSNWARAAATALSTSCAEPAETLLSTVSVAGLRTLKVSPLLESVHCPLTYIWRKPAPTDAEGEVETAMMLLLSDRRRVGQPRQSPTAAESGCTLRAASYGIQRQFVGRTPQHRVRGPERAQTKICRSEPLAVPWASLRSLSCSWRTSARPPMLM
jgi:hypothetical protein